MITESKKLKIIFLIFSLLCFLAMGICLICDLAINKEVTWATYPLIAIPFAWVAIGPLFLAKKHKIICSLIILSIVVFPFLYFMQFVTPVHGWFIPLALPIAIISVGALWITFFLLKYVKFNIWYSLAILVFLYGVVVNVTVQYFTARFVNEKLFSIDFVINIFVNIAISILTVIIGYAKRKNEKE